MVLVNEENQHSLWPLRGVPSGWAVVQAGHAPRLRRYPPLDAHGPICGKPATVVASEHDSSLG
ncbi:MbtH family NRPS accessory protein [Rhodococcus hoagii]|nr:MbtH family NRPS accessory protein [Prescottella equi]